MTIAPMSDTARDLFGERLPAAPKGRQLPLPLGWTNPASQGAARLIVGDSNRAAIRHILGPAPWPAPATILSGPAASGKSLIGRIFHETSGGELVDDLASADAEAVFHAWNRAQTDGTRLLVIADTAQIAHLALPDLRTRLASAPLVEIGAPDACLTRDLVEHLLVLRGLHPAPRLGGYVAARIERSYSAIHRAVAAIDAQALSGGQGASIATARAALIAAGLYDGSAASESTEQA